MARTFRLHGKAAFLLDHLMRKIGLPGRSLVSFIIGFGCNVPGVLSTRVLGRHEERLMSIMMAQRLCRVVHV